MKRLVPLLGAALVIAGCDDSAALSPEPGGGELVPSFAKGPKGGPRVKLTASDAAAGDRFGRPVSIDGDRFIVAADGDDDAESNSGSAYVFRFDGSRWTEEAKLTASNAAALDFFSRSVSIDGDRAIVGAPGNDNAGSKDSGSAYIFRFGGATWTEEAKLTPSDAAAFDGFGVSVSIDGDRAVVGTRHDGNPGIDRGTAYVFRYDGASWTEEAELTASKAPVFHGDDFGASVSIDGDRFIVAADGGAICLL